MRQTSATDTQTLGLINERAHNETPTLTLQSGTETIAPNLRFTKDSAFWEDAGVRKAVPNKDVKQVTFNNRMDAALSGLVYTAPVGFVAGIGVGLGQGDDPGCRICSEERKTAVDKAISNALIYGAAGAAAGAITGAIIGQRTEYNFAK